MESLLLVKQNQVQKPGLPLSTPDADLDPAIPKVSKSAQKKAAKAAQIAAFKLERRAREKEKKKEKKRELAKKRAAGEVCDGEGEGEVRATKRAKAGSRPKPFGSRVVVDLGFDELMSDKEIVSLCSQLAYTYSVNRQALFPFSILYTSLNGRTLARLESVNCGAHKRWGRTEWWNDGYESLWDEHPEDEEPSVTTRASRESVVYLTADADTELLELKPEETYVIGGICDHNRYKNLCLTKSQTSGIRSARLPISRYLSSLPTRKVLTVNQVFEILVKWVETRNWEQSFYAVIPKRKFQSRKQVAGEDEDEDKEDCCDGQQEMVLNGPEEQADPEADLPAPL